jgi:hypothetical protein
VACKSAETREQEATPDLNCTDHGESLFTVAENRFGGTEQFVCSIYRALERWPVNLNSRGGDQRGGGALAHAIGGHYRGKLTGDHWMG